MLDKSIFQQLALSFSWIFLIWFSYPWNKLFIRWITLFIFGLKTPEPEITFVIKGASYDTYIRKIFKAFAERIVKTGDMKFNSHANHVPIRKLK